MRFTKHALERMAERNITETEVLAVLADPHIFSLPGKEEDAALLFGMAGDRQITLVVNFQLETLVTLWPSSNQERRIYARNKQGN
jgi:hypothetical protein